MGRLTEAQRRELQDLAEHGPLTYAEHYKPIQRLFDLGFVEKRDGKYGATWYSITPAGRAALASLEDRA